MFDGLLNQDSKSMSCLLSTARIIWSVSCRKPCRPNCQTFLCTFYRNWKMELLETPISTAAVLFKSSFSWRECQKSHQIGHLVTRHWGTWWIHQERPSRQWHSPSTTNTPGTRFEAWWSFTADNTWWWRCLFGRDILLDSYEPMTNDSFHHVSFPCPLSSPASFLWKFARCMDPHRIIYAPRRSSCVLPFWSWRFSMKNLEGFNSSRYIVLPICLAKWERCNQVA